jgi:hypothetical protein
MRTMLRASTSAAVLALALAACRFDGSGLPADPGGDDEPPVDAPAQPPGDGAADAAVDAPVDAGVNAAPDARACPSSYVAVDGQASLYRLVTNADDWLAAERDCENDGDATGGGTHLIVLDDAAEVAAVDARVNVLAWIGMTDRVEENTFVLVTGPGAVFRPFRDGEPNDGVLASEDCVELNGNRLNDELCSSNRAYICECDGIDADPDAYTPDD